MRIPNVLRGTITWRTVDKQFNKGEEGPSLYNIGLKVTDMNSGAYVELELSLNTQEHKNTRREGERERGREGGRSGQNPDRTRN